MQWPCWPQLKHARGILFFFFGDARTLSTMGRGKKLWYVDIEENQGRDTKGEAKRSVNRERVRRERGEMKREPHWKMRPLLRQVVKAKAKGEKGGEDIFFLSHNFFLVHF